MKNILTVSLFLLCFAIPISSLHAAGISVKTITPVSFTIKVGEITKIESTGATRFSFEPVDVLNEASIDHWEIKVYCAASISVAVNEQVENECGNSVQVPNPYQDKFSVSLLNPTGKPTHFFFRLKAYGVDGRRLHVEKQSFSWK